VTTGVRKVYGVLDSDSPLQGLKSRKKIEIVSTEASRGFRKRGEKDGVLNLMD
jgi:hypothetical protein